MNHNFNAFLSAFNLTDLGEGNPNTGANILAVMACNLAAISRPGSGIYDRTEKLYPVGSSILVSDPHSSCMVSDVLMDDLAERQNNYNSHLRRKLENLVDAQKDGSPTLSPPQHNQSLEERTIDLLQDPVALMDRERPHYLGALTRTPSRPQLNEQLEKSQLYLTGRSPEGIAGQFHRVHLGRPLVHIGIDRPADFARFGMFAAALIQGRMSSATWHDSIKGHLVATDPSSFLGDRIRKGDEHSHWLGRLLWLTHDVNRELQNAPKLESPPVRLDNILGRYGEALDHAWGARLEFINPQPKITRYNSEFLQAKWITFLSTIEPQFPGITGVARNLLATISFGLHLIVGALPLPKDFKWFHTWIFAFAEFLVKRMANARMTMLHSAKHIRVKTISLKILAKLENEPLSKRTLHRHLSITADECQESLDFLDEQGLAFKNDNKHWQRSGESIPADLDITGPTLIV
ncbi:hypothetical protein N9Z83_02610 [Akkermansiaceae bacterium]|nr:hypothetical protein [Akkermansiaceae bacterium]